MEILEIRNDHLKPNKIYKCECPVCGTIFLFDSCDVRIPATYDGDDHMKKVMCPNKKYCTYIRLDNSSIEEIDVLPVKTERDELNELIYYLDKFKEKHSDVKVIIDGDKKDFTMSEIHLIYEGMSDSETVGPLVIEVE